MEKPTLHQCIMKGEINVVLAADAMSATDSAADLVKAFNAEEQRVYSVNTVYNLRVLNAMLRKRLGPDYKLDDKRNGHYYFDSRQHGELGKREDLLIDVGWDNYDVVIVTTWEMAARSYRYREALLFDLGKLSERGVTVIVFSTTTTEPKSGRADRGGVGRLSIISSNILSIAKKYSSNIGLTTAEIREAARQAWPKEYEEYAREQERKMKAAAAVAAASSEFNELNANSTVSDLPVILNEVKNPSFGAEEYDSTTAPSPAPSPQTLTPTTPECAQLSGREINILPTPRPERMSASHPLYWLKMANHPDGGEAYHPYSVAAQFRYLVEDPAMNDPLPDGWEGLYKEDKWFRKLVDDSVGFDALKAASDKAKRIRGGHSNGQRLTTDDSQQPPYEPKLNYFSGANIVTLP